MHDIITVEAIERARGVLKEQNVKPQPFIIVCTPGYAKQVADSFGFELSLDENGEQRIGDYLIVTKPHIQEIACSR